MERRDSSDRRQVADRREYLRVRTETTVRFLRAAVANEVLSAHLKDVSPTGVRIAVREPLFMGENILIEVRASESACFNLSAQAVWIEDHPEDGHLVGCELRVDLSRRQLTLLREALVTVGQQPA